MQTVLGCLKSILSRTRIDTNSPIWRIWRWHMTSSNLQAVQGKHVAYTSNIYPHLRNVTLRTIPSPTELKTDWGETPSRQGWSRYRATSCKRRQLLTGSSRGRGQLHWQDRSCCTWWGFVSILHASAVVICLTRYYYGHTIAAALCLTQMFSGNPSHLYIGTVMHILPLRSYITETIWGQ